MYVKQDIRKETFMQEELLVTRRDGRILSVRVEDGNIVQIQADLADTDNVLGNIYVGKVRNIVKNINAAFVEFQEGQIGYLSLNTSCYPLHTDGVPHRTGRVCIGDEIIVQVTREAVRTKPPTLSGKLELAGRYVVLMAVGEAPCDPRNTSVKEAGDSTQEPVIQGVSVSKKIQEKEVRERLKQLMSSYCTPEYGFVARTNSAAVSEAELCREMEELIRQYQEITRFGKHKARYQILRQTPGSYLSQIRDSYQDRLTRIWTDDDLLYQEMQQYMLENGWQAQDLLERWNPDRGKLDAVYNLSKTIEHALMPRVWLKHGGYLVIQPTEALVSIDVNTGKAISKKKDIQQTFRNTNLEAAQEIARQLRLRNLSGMILIDFIDMKAETDQQEVMDALKRAVSRDPVQTTVVDMTKLGLVEMTRKKIRKPLYEQLRTGK